MAHLAWQLLLAEPLVVHAPAPIGGRTQRSRNLHWVFRLKGVEKLLAPPGPSARWVWAAAFACQAFPSSVSPGCSWATAHHHGKGVTVVRTHSLPSFFGYLWVRASTMVSFSPLGLTQKPMS